MAGNVSPVAVFSIVFPLLLVAAFFFTAHLTAAVGGWRELARVYRADGPIAGAREWRNRGGRMRYATQYNGCLNIAANAMGVQLSLWRIFPAHPPLFIPWSDIQTEPVDGMLFAWTRLSFRRAAPTLMLKRDLADQIIAARRS